jgi:hypothetical protein
MRIEETIRNSGDEYRTAAHEQNENRFLGAWNRAANPLLQRREKSSRLQFPWNAKYEFGKLFGYVIGASLGRSQNAFSAPILSLHCLRRLDRREVQAGHECCRKQPLHRTRCRRNKNVAGSLFPTRGAEGSTAARAIARILCSCGRQFYGQGSCAPASISSNVMAATMQEQSMVALALQAPFDSLQTERAT